jgi:hypothetical protein
MGTVNGRLVLALVFLVGGASVAFVGAQPEASLTPAEAEEAADGHARVKGVVQDVDRETGTFLLAGEGANVTVHVDDLPTAVAAGNGLWAEGQLSHGDGETVLAAEAIQMGCPSKSEG